MYRVPTDTITGTGHEIGKTYLSTYWRKKYLVLGHGEWVQTPDDERMTGVRVLWEDGRTTTHNTLRDKDPIVEPFS